MLETTLGKYKIDGFIAEGGMARILRAKTEGVGGVDKVVALKCLKGSLQEDDNFVQMLRDEALITVNMTHKNICQVYGLEHDEDKYFMVMEYIDGVNLAELANYLFSLNRVFPIEAAVFIAMEVCCGLSYAHRMLDDSGESLGIVHRDVNPQNICISKEGEVKLIDFGIAKARQEDTQVGTIKGKFNYMSPEQARGDRVDQRTDVFALGAVLYEMLCGHMLYPLALDDARLRSKTRMADFVPIETYLPDIPDKLKKILTKALARDINQRFATSRDFLLALTQFSHDSCKVYDGLNLAMLVEKYLAHKKGKTSSEANPNPAAAAPSAPSAAKAHSGSGLLSVNISNKTATVNSKPAISIQPEPDFSLDSSDTAVISAVEARKLAENGLIDNSGEDTATSVYSKAEFDAAVEAGLVNINPPKQDTDNSLVSDALCRSVDLDIADAGKDSTVMVFLDEVKPNTATGRFVDSCKKLFQRILSLEEKTLVIAAICLVAVLSLCIFLFVHALTSDPEQEQNTETVVPQNTAADARTIFIKSDPDGAQIFIGNDLSDKVTPASVSVPANVSKIVIKKLFYKPFEVDLNSRNARNTGEIVASLEEMEKFVEIHSTPDHATVYVDGDRAEGLTPTRVRLSMSREHTIEIRLEGYKAARKTIKWKSEDEDISISKELKQLKSKKK